MSKVEETKIKQQLMQKDKEALVELLLQKMFDCEVVEQELAKLKSKYEDCDKERLENRMEYLTMKNKWLNSEQQLTKLKEKAIVPRFKKGDTAYAIIDTTFYTDVFKVNILDTELCYRVDRGDNDISTQHHTRLFTTEQEAQEKLKEMKGNEQLF